MLSRAVAGCTSDRAMCHANGLLLLLALPDVRGPGFPEKITHPMCCAVVRSGYQATAHFSRGLWSLMALKPSQRELSDGDGQHGGPDGHAPLDTTSDDDDFAPLGGDQAPHTRG